MAKLFKWGEFRVERVSLKHADTDGICRWDKGTLQIDKHLRGRRELETLIHEGLHALDPDAGESRVTHTGRMLAELLWKYGYRIKPRAKRRGGSDGGG